MRRLLVVLLVVGSGDPMTVSSRILPSPSRRFPTTWFPVVYILILLSPPSWAGVEALPTTRTEARVIQL